MVLAGRVPWRVAMVSAAAELAAPAPAGMRVAEAQPIPTELAPAEPSVMEQSLTAAVTA